MLRIKFLVFLFCLFTFFSFIISTECPNQNQLHQMNDTLCGVTNITVLKCHERRVHCESDGHWTSVCLFIPSEDTGLKQDFLANYRSSYNCEVTKDFVHANCTSKMNSKLNFLAACNYTFYFCKNNPIFCLENFARELEGNNKHFLN